ncbi:gfo/Idh/MocA family oxidoreductase [Nakamurella sp. YIM 132087]|uniref:Gfo/Idh/MocA family oxidoreductase n=1 Tax=Nakamurella alba TaxID=2665158 RepID=A0A7K1FL04_9ACTN|nr:Gfo/Idh/MocA family oxidoreductase [Nakamurella alba]MTD14821.1 gfo/Idh/MocA family oxidoreductase [Nakamurella alba]
MPAPSEPVAGLRVGIIGGGFMADVHSRAVRSSFGRVVALASSSPERAAAPARRVGAERAVSVDDLLAADDIDVVHVCSPNATHTDLARRALAAGKHVVCEKPLAVTVAEAEELVGLAAVSGLVTSVPFVYRFHPLVRELRSRLAGQRVFSVQGAYLQDWLLDPADDNWRVDEGAGGASRAFGDIGSHLVDLIEFVTGDRIVAVRAHTRTVHPERGGHPVATEDLVAAVAEFAGGAVGTLLVSQVAAGRKNGLTVEISTPQESLRFEQESPETVWIGRRRGSELLPRDADQLSADAARLCAVPSGHPMGYQDAFNAFVADTYAAVRGAAPDGLPVFADGLRAAQVTAAVLESARTGTDVTLPEGPA